MLKNSAAGLNVAGWIKSFKVSLMLTFASTILHCYLGAGGAASAFRLQMKILKHQNKSGICLGRAGFFT